MTMRFCPYGPHLIGRIEYEKFDNFNSLNVWLLFQQKHWPSHMTTCAQNQSNQDEDSAGGSANDNHLEALEHSGAASHFLGQVMKVRKVDLIVETIPFVKTSPTN